MQSDFSAHFAALRAFIGFARLGQGKDFFDKNTEFTGINQLCDLLQL